MVVGYFELDALQDKLSFDKGCTLKQNHQILGQFVILHVWYNKIWII